MKRVSALDWCNALVASDPTWFHQLCDSAEARACVNDRCVFNNPNNARIQYGLTPLECAVKMGTVPFERVQKLIDEAGAEPTTKALNKTYSRGDHIVSPLFLLLLSRGARHDYGSFGFYITEHLTNDEERIQCMLEYPEFAASLARQFELSYARLWSIAQYRHTSARDAATAVMGLHRQGPLYQNKDVLGLIAKQVKYQTTSSKWGKPSIFKSIQRNLKEPDSWAYFAFLLLLFFSVVFISVISLAPPRPKTPKNNNHHYHSPFRDLQVMDISSIGGKCPPPVPVGKWRGNRRNSQRLVNKRSSANSSPQR